MAKKLSTKALQKRLTKTQSKWLEYYPLVLDIYEAARLAGIRESNILKMLHRNTLFARKAAKLIQDVTDRISNDPRLNKIGSIAALLSMEKSIKRNSKIRPYQKYKLLLEVRREINKMVEGNLAASNHNVKTNIDISVKGVYDLTQGNRNVQIESNENNLLEEADDAEYEES